MEGAVRLAQSVGFKAIIVVGSDLVSNRKVLQIAQTFSDYIFLALDFIQWQIEAGQLEKTLEAMDSEVGRCVVLGDVGQRTMHNALLKRNHSSLACK